LQHLSHDPRLANYDIGKYIKRANEFIESEFVWGKRRPPRIGIGPVTVEILRDLLKGKIGLKYITLYAFDPGLCTVLAEIYAFYRDTKSFNDPPLVILGFNMH